MVVFLLVFVLFLVIFGGLCLWAIVKLNGETKGRSSSSSTLLNISCLLYTSRCV